jgi:putative NADH-flavin reductase
MRLLVFGSTGGTGREIVDQALAQGHTVTALARDPAKLGKRHARLTVVQGDVLDAASVEQAMPDHEAVLCAIGAGTRGGLRSAGTRNIVRAMEKAGVRRLVCQTSLGYGDSREVLNTSPLYFKYIVVPFVLRRAFADHAQQEEHIQGSGLDWIIVRPANLTDGPRTGLYRHGFPATDRTIKVHISRADVADFMLKQLSDDTYLRKKPGVSY